MKKYFQIPFPLVFIIRFVSTYAPKQFCTGTLLLYHQLNFEPDEFVVGSHLLIQWVYESFIITELAIGLQGMSFVLMTRAFVFAIFYHLELKRG